MDQPSTVKDNFTAQGTLVRNPDTYNIRAYVYNLIDLYSDSALGGYQYNCSIYINGVAALTGSSYGAGWVSTNYRLNAGGPSPDLCCQAQPVINLHVGVNLFEFRFVQFSKLSKYDMGYYHITIGPFKVDVSSKAVSIIGPLTLEIIVDVILVPVSLLLSLASHRMRRTGRPRPPQCPRASWCRRDPQSPG